MCPAWSATYQDHWITFTNSNCPKLCTIYSNILSVLFTIGIFYLCRNNKRNGQKKCEEAYYLLHHNIFKNHYNTFVASNVNRIASKFTNGITRFIGKCKRL